MFARQKKRGRVLQHELYVNLNEAASERKRRLRATAMVQEN